MQFGNLQTPQQIQKHFQQLRLQSRAQLIAEIYKHIPASMHPVSVEKDLTDAFCVILDGYAYDKTSPIVKELTHLFDLEAIRRLPPQDRKSRVYQKILCQVEEKLKTIQVPEIEAVHSQIANPESHFEWVGASSKYPSLRAIFQEILLQKVKLFDAELTELTTFQQLKYHETEDLLKMKTQSTDLVVKIRPNTAKVREIHRKIEGQFTDVLIRDKSEFTLKKWTAKEQGQFRSKKKHTLRINNVPVLFQFVKKYTQTVKARDNIYAKWEQRERTGITPEELRYLCATSVFLNNSLNISEKKRIQGNIKSAGRVLVSKLEFNIAEKIIETYKLLTRKVSDLRAKYYQQETEKRKLNFAQGKSIQKNKAKINSRLEEFRKYEAMFRKILQGERMQIKLRFNILRWVKLFISNLKRKIKKKSNGPTRTFSSANKSTPLLRRLKLLSPASKVIKREEEQSHRLKATRYLPSSRFQYQPSLQKTITALNSTRLPYHSSSEFKKHLTGGPVSKSDAIYVDLIRKKVQLSSTKCLRGVIAIQSKWRAVYYRKRYLERIKIVREQIKVDFARKIQSLSVIYPRDKKINMQAVKSRLMRGHMQINHILQPYVRVIRRQVHTYTSFCVNKLSLPELKLKHARNGVIRLGEFGTFVQKNQYNLLKKSGLVVTSKEINDPIYKNQASAIWWAVKHSNIGLTTTLLEGGGDPNSADVEGNTCLHVAIRNGDPRIIFILLDYGGDLNFRNKQKMTPLFFATQKMLCMLGLQEGNVASMGQNSKDNNGLFFKTRVSQEDIYRQHFF